MANYIKIDKRLYSLLLYAQFRSRIRSRLAGLLWRMDARLAAIFSFYFADPRVKAAVSIATSYGWWLMVVPLSQGTDWHCTDKTTLRDIAYMCWRQLLNRRVEWRHQTPACSMQTKTTDDALQCSSAVHELYFVIMLLERNKTIHGECQCLLWEGRVTLSPPCSGWKKFMIQVWILVILASPTMQQAMSPTDLTIRAMEEWSAI